MTLFLHIGYHKTGSTALQRYLTTRRASLAARGLEFPHGLSAWLGHPELAWVFAPERYPWQDRDYDRAAVLDTYRTMLDAASCAGRDIVVTSEEFDRLDFSFKSMQRLAEFLTPWRPVIVGFVRDPLEFLLSRYRHEILAGAETRSLAAFLSCPDNVLSANFPFRTHVWDQAFDGRCLFRHYARTASDFSTVAGFFEAIGRPELSALPPDAPETDWAALVDDVALHPALLSAARLVAKSGWSAERCGALIETLLALGRELPPLSLDAYPNHEENLGGTVAALATLDLSRISLDRQLSDLA